MSDVLNFPPQQLPFNKKTKAWRKKVMDFADSKSFFNYSLVRKSVIHKKINYDLMNGHLHMSDLTLIVNPEGLRANYIPDNIQHYPIMNSKINVLKGEESKRVFDYRVVVTNPTAISEIETAKRDLMIQELQMILAESSQNEQEYNQKVQTLSDYYNYEWQDLREIRANALLKHYVKEYNFPMLFNEGFSDAMIVGEEIYQCDIVGGEPIIEKLNPLKVRVFRSGYSNRIEDADMIILEDYWSPGRVIDTYYDVLSKKDIEYIEKLPNHLGQASVDEMDNRDERYAFINANMVDETFESEFYFDPLNSLNDGYTSSLLPYDTQGNLRVLRVYWKSRRKIKKVKSYDPETGEEVYNLYPETYVINKDLGEEEEIFYINEAWEGTKIGSDIYVNMRPRAVQYNRLSNPSRCHFGIVGSIYNINDSRPFSLVDMMKQYNYYYDVIHDRLNKMLARNWGKLVRMDLAKVPKGWDIEKWMYYARTSGIVVEDSFKEGNSGAALGKLVGGLNNASNGVFDAEFGNSIQFYINMLEFIKTEMSEVAGITRQREGQISNRETVGGVERATLQSSHITEWLFIKHDDVKKRAMECFLETAKIALKGRNKKFQYILPNKTLKMMDIDGDEFAESDYGLVIDNSSDTQELSQKIDMLAQAALQNQTLSFSAIMNLYGSNSLAEKQRLIEKDEKAMQERAAQQQQQELQAQQQIQQMQMQQKQAEIEQREQANIRDNETKILVATIQAESNNEDKDVENIETDNSEFLEKIRQFDAKLKLDRDKFEFDKVKHKDDVALKNKQINKQSVNRTNK